MKRLLVPILLLCGILGLAPPIASAMQQIDIETELRLLEQGIPLPRHISGAKYRVAVFTYEDPGQTGLGNALSALVGAHILMNSGVSSLGVLRYEGQLSPRVGGGLSYFDKVDRLTEAQEVSLAVWGMVRQLGSRLVIDTYVQIPPKISAAYFAWRLQLPQRMGQGALQAHLRPDRIPLQRLSIPVASSNLILEAARDLDELREEPSSASRVIARLPQGVVYWVNERRGDWARFKTPAGLAGWVPVAGHCREDCRPLLDAAQFSASLLTYMQNRAQVPKALPGLSVEALAVSEQIRALDALNGTIGEIYEISLALAERWTGPRRLEGVDRATGIDRGRGIAPGGAAFANIQALARMAVELQEAFRRQSGSGAGAGRSYDELAIAPEQVEALAFDLAEASLIDPDNLDVLHNLNLLFAYAGQTARARLAKELAEKVSAAAGSN